MNIGPQDELHREYQGQAPLEGEGPTNPSVRYEERDFNSRAVLLSLAGLGLAVLLAMLLLWPINVYLSTRAAASRSSNATSQNTVPKSLPPRSEGSQFSPQLDMRMLRSEADTVLNSYGWVDQQAGIARIPIERAMRLLVEQSASATGAGQTEHAPGGATRTTEHNERRED
jgi:hypothetical protein